jgi:hypothetical protein
LFFRSRVWSLLLSFFPYLFKTVNEDSVRLSLEPE